MYVGFNGMIRGEDVYGTGDIDFIRKLCQTVTGEVRTNRCSVSILPWTLGALSITFIGHKPFDNVPGNSPTSASYQIHGHGDNGGIQ